MNRFKKLLVVVLGLVLGASAQGRESDPTVVPAVDFNRYAGFWYDIARNPSYFQNKCLHSIAEYAVLTETSVSVKNTCYQDEGKVTRIEGVATVKDVNQSAKLRVKFSFFQRGDYWITELDPNYEWAVVSGPHKKSLFILARYAPMDKNLLASILATLQSKGFDTSQLIYDQY
ncbi:MAG: lipocalin family protein [Bdellovibrio sp.]|nr:lipocalin family protein [Bdellovibrio sp.]